MLKMQIKTTKLKQLRACINFMEEIKKITIVTETMFVTLLVVSTHID